ncbi:Chitin binding protein [Methanosarcina barkeri str. Wiesmoor]|uniref:Chitin binding protein n=1 Tax=Methanosarcina barkeri str. Wiesmoor TaxID=1434109 RepID=A0A0E3QMR1_METBA|nr:S8 family serine peptidase [Methanosarcina barkeri]AKB52358.1 Chitin binding protein [Methanosarcina barkeri str. Wiesmoor]
MAGDINTSPNINSDDKISASVVSKLTEISGDEQIPVIITLPNQKIAFNTAAGKYQIESEQKNLIKFLENEKSKNKVNKIKPIKIINAVAAKVNPEVLASLAGRSDVSKIELDEVVSIVGQSEPSFKKIAASTTLSTAASTNAWGVDKIDAPAVWQQGINGKGITVAVVDTGIDATHPDLDDLDDNPSTNDPKVVGWVDYINSQSSAYDDNGHGTHVAGIVSGTGDNGIQTGVAPGTKLLVAKVFDSEGDGYLSTCILGFEWAVNNNARIISFSGGSPEHDSLFTTMINKVVAAGVVPVIAAGNDGDGSGTITCPGDELNSLTVGATDSSDAIADFSSRGPVTLDDQTYIKPDISAPGVSIPSTYPGDGYAYGDGTSMAAPHVSGTVALILEKKPTMTPAEVKKELESTAVDLGSAGKDNDYGSGRIDAYDAVFGKGPVANFYAKPTSGKVPLTVAFTDTSTGTPTKWRWNFGDGSKSFLQNPKHKYSKAGTYTVNLTVKNAKGKNTVTKTDYIVVISKPTAAFSASPTSGKAPLTVAFTDKSSGNPTAWKWSFGDGTISREKNPTHQYLQEGKYKITLTVSNAAGKSTTKKINYIKVTTNTRPGIYSESK